MRRIERVAVRIHNHFVKQHVIGACLPKTIWKHCNYEAKKSVL